MGRSGPKWIYVEMKKFRGSSFHTIDSKGRIIVPARFRQLLHNDGDEDGIMVTQQDNCLYAYPYDEWDQLETKIASLSETSETIRRFRRRFIGNAHDCKCDKQDRILVPPSLRQYAALDKEIVLAGVGKYFEIWARDRWDQEMVSVEDELKDKESRNEIAKLGI